MRGDPSLCLKLICRDSGFGLDCFLDTGFTYFIFYVETNFAFLSKKIPALNEPD